LIFFESVSSSCANDERDKSIKMNKSCAGCNFSIVATHDELEGYQIKPDKPSFLLQSLL